MTTIKMTVKQVEKLAKSSHKVCGCFNFFFKVTDRIGIKGTMSEAERDGNYDRQSLAAKHGLGPEVFGKIDFEYKGKKVFAYFTEIVTVFNDELSTKEYIHFYRFHKENIGGLCDELEEKIGFVFLDCHNGNTGIKNGKLICIDFDDSSNRFDKGTFLPSDPDFEVV